MSTTNTFSIEVMYRLRGGANIINTTTEKYRLWPDSVIPYEIDLIKYPVGINEREIILTAIKEWNGESRNTGFKLVPRREEIDYLIFGEENGVCYSNVGRVGGRQYIRCDLDGGGFNERSIKHEICHAAGFHHEHQRWDRDNYVVVNSIDSKNYGKTSFDNMFKEYDFNSIMHYHFSPKLQPQKNLQINESDVGTQKNLSSGDLAALSHLSQNANTSSTRRPTKAAANITNFYKPVFTELKDRARMAFDAKDYSSASRYYLSLYDEYRGIAEKNEVSNWCLMYGVCKGNLNDLNEAEKGFKISLEYNSSNTSAIRNLKKVERQRKEESNPCNIL